VRVLLFLAGVTCFAQPKWVSIATPSEPYQYFRYGSEPLEDSRFSATVPHPAPSFSYSFLRGKPGARTVCPLKDRADVYWYSPAGKHLDGTYATPNPSEFNISAIQTGIQGFAVTAVFAGSASGNGSAIEVAYFTDRVCSDAGVEYGFSRDLATSSILVYWSTYANCGNDAASLCRKTGDPSLGDHFSNVQQENGGTTSRHGFRIYGIPNETAHTYRIWIDRHSLRVEVWRNGQLAKCSEAENRARRPCSFEEAVEQWFPIDRLSAGYIVTGTQTAGDPKIADGSRFQVSDILVAK
jgi:hypothetical protein